MKRFFQLFAQLFRRELKLFRSNNVALVVFFAAPLGYALLIGSVYSDAVVTKLPVMVVDLDKTPLSNNIIDALNDNQYLSVKEVAYLSANYREKLTKENYHAIITIPDGFEGDIQQKRYPEIDVDVNAANMLTANYITTGVQTTLSYLNAGIEMETLKKKGMPQAIAEKQFESFKINITRFFNPSSNYLMFLAPGMLGTIMQQVFLLVLALCFAKEFDEGHFTELLGKTKSATMMIFSKSFPYLLIGALIWFPLIHIGFGLDHIPMVKHLFPYFTITILFFLAIMAMGICVSIFIPSQLKATEVLMVIATPSFIISGQTWPLCQMPAGIRYFAEIVPATHYLEAFRRMLLMEASWADLKPQIYKLLILFGIFSVLSLVLLKYKIRKSR